MFDVNTTMLNALREGEVDAMKKGNRLALAISNYYTKVLNEGFDEIAQGVLIVFLPYAISPTQEDIAMSCLYMNIVFYPQNIDDFCTLSDFRLHCGGISMNKFDKSTETSPDVDVGQLVAMYAVNNHINEKFKLGRMMSYVQDVIMRIQSKYGDVRPHTPDSIEKFPSAMNAVDIVYQVMKDISEDLEAQI